MGPNVPKSGGVQGLRSLFAATERRRPRQVDQSPVEVLQHMPGLVVLQRLPVPTLAVDREGAILFANGAFSHMLGHAPDELLAMKFGDVFYGLAPHHAMTALVSAHADRLVKLAHKDGYPVWATMSKSAMRRRDDALALAIFRDRTEELWRNSVDR